MVLSTASMKAKNEESGMKLLCLRGVVTSKGVVNAGETVEGLPALEVKTLIGAGKLVEFEEQAVPAIQHRDPVDVQAAIAAPSAAPRRGRPPKFTVPDPAAAIEDETE